MREPERRPPAVRASDEEREAAVARLRTAAGEGRLALDELAERLDRAFAAATRAELEPLVADLSSEPGPEQAPPRGRRWIVGIMGGGTHRGRWRIAPRCCRQPDGRLRIEGAPRPPRGAPMVRVRAYSVMGGTDVRLARR